jgi:hypothetical protein
MISYGMTDARKNHDMRPYCRAAPAVFLAPSLSFLPT